MIKTKQFEQYTLEYKGRMRVNIARAHVGCVAQVQLWAGEPVVYGKALWNVHVSIVNAATEFLIECLEAENHAAVPPAVVTAAREFVGWDRCTNGGWRSCTGRGGASCA